MSPDSLKSTLPVKVGDVIILKRGRGSADQTGCKSFVIGYSPHEFLIVKASSPFDQTFDLNDGSLLCALFHEGVFYYFQTSVRLYVQQENILLLDYPSQFQRKKVRKHPRIPVNLQVRLTLKNEESPGGFGKKIVVDELLRSIYHGRMMDISEGGCRVVLRSFQEIPVHSLSLLSFTLPDNQQIEGLEALIVSCRPAGEHAVEAGLKFRGPVAEQGKVTFFCQVAIAIQRPPD